MSRHAKRARKITEKFDATTALSAAEELALAQAHALLAIGEAIESWQPPGEPSEDDIPFEETAAGFDAAWNRQ